MKKIKCKNCGNINLLQISNDRDLYKCKHCGVEFTVELRFENLTFFGILLLAAMIGTKLSAPLDLSIEFISILVTIIFAVIGAKRPADPVGWQSQSEGRAFNGMPSCEAGFHTKYERREARHLYVWVRPYKMQIRNKTKKINDD